MPMDVIEPRLLSLAVASGAQLRVADDGNVTYVFPAQLRRLLLARSWRLRFAACLRKVGSLLFWMIRCSFGVVLVVLVVLISLLVLLLGLALFWAEDDAANALLSVVGGAEAMESSRSSRLGPSPEGAHQNATTLATGPDRPLL